MLGGVVGTASDVACPEQTVRGGVLKQKAGFVVLDGVHQTARGAGDGQGAVAHRDHLGKTAGLEAAGDEQRVRARVDEVRQRFVVADVGTDPPRVGGGGGVQCVFHVVVTRAQNCQAPVLPQQFAQRFDQNIDAFLICQTRDDADDGFVGLEPEPLTQRRFIDRLAVKILSRIRRG